MQPPLRKKAQQGQAKTQAEDQARVQAETAQAEARVKTWAEAQAQAKVQAKTRTQERAPGMDCDTGPTETTGGKCNVLMLSGCINKESSMKCTDIGEETRKLKKKTVPLRDVGNVKEFVTIWVKAQDEVLPRDNLYSATCKCVTVLVTVDPTASFQCVFDDSEAILMERS